MIREREDAAKYIVDTFAPVIVTVHQDSYIRFWTMEVCNILNFQLTLNPIALRKAKIVCNFGLSECNRAKCQKCKCMLLHLQQCRS